MSCEKCWRDASLASLLLGGSVTDHYRRVLQECQESPCTTEEERGDDPSDDLTLVAAALLFYAAPGADDGTIAKNALSTSTIQSILHQVKK